MLHPNEKALILALFGRHSNLLAAILCLLMLIWLTIKVPFTVYNIFYSITQTWCNFFYGSQEIKD